MARRNLIADLGQEIAALTKKEIHEKAKKDALFLCMQLSENGSGIKGLIMGIVLAAKIGGFWDGNFDQDERELFDDVVTSTFDNVDDVTPLYQVITASPVSDNDFEPFTTLAQGGSTVLMSALYLILGFAYIDGKCEDELMQKLDEMYGMQLGLLIAMENLGND